METKGPGTQPVSPTNAKKPSVKQHIFPSDFLRWPATAQAVRVPSKEHGAITAGLKVATPTQNSSFSQQFNNQNSNSTDSFNSDETSLLLGNGQENADWWAKFKSKFGHKSGYEQL